MMHKNEIIAWLQALPDDTLVGVDEDGHTLCTEDFNHFLILGGTPEYEDDEDFDLDWLFEDKPPEEPNITYEL